MKGYFCGLDLHSNNTYIGIMDQDGKRVFQKRVPNGMETILKYLDPFKEQLKGAVVESTFNWYWLIDGLMDEGFTVHLAHPPAIIQYNGIKCQGDKHSAFHLANLLRMGCLPQGYILPRELRHLRDLLRKRMMLVQTSTRYILNFKSMVKRNRCDSITSDDIKKLTPETLPPDLFTNPHLHKSGQLSLKVIQFMKKEIDDLKKSIRKAALPLKGFQNLLSITGIGDILGMTIILETGPIQRFPKVGNYASYSRCVQAVRSSNNKKKGAANRKNGNKYLGWAFLEGAHKLKRFCPAAKKFYERKCRKTNNIVAIKALAHKICRAAYYIQKDDVPFDEKKMFGLSSQTHKRGRGSKSKWGLASNPSAPIDHTAATPLAN